MSRGRDGVGESASLSRPYNGIKAWVKGLFTIRGLLSTGVSEIFRKLASHVPQSSLVEKESIQDDIWEWLSFFAARLERVMHFDRRWN